MRIDGSARATDGQTAMIAQRRAWLVLLLVMLLVGCNQVSGAPNDTTNNIAGSWVDLGDRAILLHFQPDGTISAPDRPLLDGAHYQLAENDQLLLTVPVADTDQRAQVPFQYRVFDGTLTLTEPTSAQSTTYRRIIPVVDLASLLPGPWIQGENANAVIEFDADGTVAMEGFFGSANGRYLLGSSDQVIFELEGIPPRAFRVWSLEKQLLFRNDQGEYMILARLPEN